MLKLACCLLLVSQVLLPVVMSQRPFYAPHPWMDRFGVIDGGSSSTNTPAPPASNGLNNRDNIPSGITFRYFNNVPVQGPEDPCMGCVYRLTSNGFIRA